MSSTSSDTFISYLLNILKTLNIKTLQIQHVKNKQQQQNSNLSSDINTIWNDVFYNKAMVNQIFKYLIDDDSGMMDANGGLEHGDGNHFDDSNNTLNNNLITSQVERRIIKIIIYDIIKFCPTTDINKWDIILQSSKFDQYIYIYNTTCNRYIYIDRYRN